MMMMISCKWIFCFSICNLQVKSIYELVFVYGLKFFKFGVVLCVIGFSRHLPTKSLTTSDFDDGCCDCYTLHP